MQEKSLLVVFGATGAQGGSLIRTILASQQLCDKYRVRGVCRNTGTPAAEALKTQGVELISADMSSKDDVARALMGAHAVFLVTDYQGNACDALLEFQQGKNVADVAKEIGVGHLVFSSLLPVSKISSNAITNAREFDSKSAIETYIREIGIPATFVLVAFYMSLFTPGQLVANPEDTRGPWSLALPLPVDDAKIPLLDIENDFGEFVRLVLLRRDSFLGARLYAAQGFYSLAQIADSINRRQPPFSRRVEAKQLSDLEFINSGEDTPERQAERMAMYQFLQSYGYYGDPAPDLFDKVLEKSLQTFDDFVASHPSFLDTTL